MAAKFKGRAFQLFEELASRFHRNGPYRTSECDARSTSVCALVVTRRAGILLCLWVLEIWWRWMWLCVFRCTRPEDATIATWFIEWVRATVSVGWRNLSTQERHSTLFMQTSPIGHCTKNGFGLSKAMAASIYSVWHFKLSPDLVSIAPAIAQYCSWPPLWPTTQLNGPLPSLSIRISTNTWQQFIFSMGALW